METAPFLDPEWLKAPSPARMYDYFLGGYHNIEIDRQAAERVIAISPDVRLSARANRLFLRRAVLFLVEQGIDQFLDIGSGIPTVGNVHEVAQQVNPATRVVYADIDPTAVAHSRSILEGNTNAAAVQADFRQIETILDLPEVQQQIDFGKPVGVLLVALLHFVLDDAEIRCGIQRLREIMAPGSYIVISHASADGHPPELVEQIRRIYARSTNPVRPRSRSEIEALFEGFELVAPGVVYPPEWHPDSPEEFGLDDPKRTAGFAGVGMKS
jgi:hypothetical protein